MHIELKAYPKCECGADLVPIIREEKVAPDMARRHNHLLGKKFLLWKCSKCKKVVDINGEKD